ncbi:hypothetical protein GCM10028807_51600 [Spirosoma daeguense]
MNSLTYQTDRPYQNEALNKIYDKLFCDDLALYQSEQPMADYPWNVLLNQNPVVTNVAAVAADASLKSRQRLLAYRLLTNSGFPIAKQELLGVVIEVAMPEGLDVLAAFSDGTARYLNYSEKLIVWESRTPEANQLINQLFAHSGNVVGRIGRWDGARRPFPTNGQLRLNFLVSDGLYFGEGPFNALYADVMGKPVIDAAIQLMTYLTQMSLSNKN